MKSLVIDKTGVRTNLRLLKQKAGSAELIADLSGDACGMGLVETARLLRDDGVRAFAVAEARDAATLRKNGFVEERIMMLRGTADTKELEQLVDYGIICAVTSHDDAVALNGIAEERHTVCEVQIKIDTGLGRFGFLPEEIDKVESIFKYMPKLAVVGMYSTLCTPLRKRQAEEQISRFQAMAEQLTNAGYKPGLLHICDDAALLAELPLLDAVRIGPALTGCLPGKQVAGLVKVGSIAAGAEEIRWQPKGSRVCGKKIWSAKKTAILSVGWYHGFGAPEKGFSLFALLRGNNSTRMGLLDGTPVKVLGRPGMMTTVLDVTGIACAIGAEIRLEAAPWNVKGLPREYR